MHLKRIISYFYLQFPFLLTEDTITQLFTADFNGGRMVCGCCWGAGLCGDGDGGVDRAVLDSVPRSRSVLLLIHHSAEHYIIIILSVRAATLALFRHAACWWGANLLLE